MTDKPVYFFGAGAADAKPTAGFDVALVEFTVDTVGLGTGSMAPAARVKPGGPDGVEIDAYENSPVKLLSVMKLIK